MNTHSQARPLRLALALLIGAGLGCGRTQPLPRVDLLRSSVTVDRSSGLVADGADTVTITVKLVDVEGKSAAGRRVGFSATGTGNVFDPPSAISDETGTVISRLSSVRAGLKTLTATLNPDTRPQPLSEQPSVSFVAGAVDPSSSTLEVNPSTLTADGVAAATITVTLRDAHGNPTPGHAVELSATGEGGLLTQPAATDENGVTAGALASTRAGRKVITATVDPGSPAQAILVPRPEIDFVPGPPSATASTVEANPSSVLADGFATTTVTVTLRDVQGNPVPGLPVALEASGSSNLIGQPTLVTDALGVTTGTVASTRAEVKTLTAIANPGSAQVVLAQQPTVTFTPGAPSIFGVTLDVSPRVLVADGVSTATLTVTVRDLSNNPVPGQVVQLSVTGSGNALVQPAGLTDTGGVATGSVTSTRAELKMVTAVINPGPGQLTTAPQLLFFIPGPPSAITSSLVASPVQVLADGLSRSTLTVTVMDAHGNPVPAQQVELSSTGSGNTLIQPVAGTDLGGVAAGSLASTRAELKTVTAVINPGPSQITLAQQATVSFFPGPPNASASTVTALPATVAADGVATSLVTVTVVDAFGNPLSGQVVSLSASGTGNILTQPAAPTGAAGVTTGTLASTRAEVKTLTATVNPGPSQVVLAQQPTVTFTPGPPSAAESSVTASPLLVTADGSSVTTVTVVVRDARGNPIPGLPVQLAATGSGNVLAQPGPTDFAGTTTGTLASTRAELKTLTATVNPGPGQVVLPQQPVVAFVPGPPSDTVSTVTARPTTAPADGAATSVITVTVLDANGNPIPGQTVQLAATGSRNTLVQPAGPTDASGVATGTLASTRAEVKTVTATVNPGGPSQVVLAQQPTVTFTPLGPDAAQSSLTANPTTVVADGVASSTLTVTVRDANGNPVPGQTVQLVATGGGNTLVQPTGPTDASGVATGTIASTGLGLKLLTATVNPGPGQVVLAQRAAVSFVAGPPSATASTVTAAPATVVANGVATSTITVTVMDSAGHPLSGLTVALSATGSGNTLVQPTGPTNGSGVVTGTLASTRAGVKTVTATINPGPSQVVLVQQPTVTFIPGPPSATVSTVAAAPTTVVADGTSTSTITVTVMDAQGNPIPGQTVQLAATGPRNTLVQPAGPTDASGVATGTIASTALGSKTITATVNPGASQVVLAQRPTVTFVPGPPSATASTVTANPTSLVANGVAISTITVTVVDDYGHPLSGLTVALSASGSGNLLVQPAGPTNASGMTTGTLASTKAEVKTVTATVSPGASQVVLAQQPTVTFVPGPPSATTSTVTANPTSVIADGVATSTLTVTVTDAQGNPISGQLVQLAATGTGNTLVQPTGPTNASGVATGTLASTKAEVKTVTATVNPGPSQLVLAQRPTVTFVPGPPSATASTVTASPTSLVADGVATSVISITLRDAQGNLVPGQVVSLSATGSNNLFVQPPNTDASGFTQGTLASTKAEVKTITATVNPGASQVVLAQQPTVTFVPGPPSATASTVVANPTSLPADAVSTSTITVTVKDAQGNPISGQVVSLAASGSSNTVTQPATPTSAAGVATGTIASGKAEAKQLTATVNPGASQVVLSQRPIVTFLAGNPGPVPGSGCTQNSSVAINPATGRPGIAYYQGSDLWFTECTSNCVLAPVWSTPVRVDAGVISCNRPDAALTLLYLPSGAPAIAYRNLTNCTAKYAVRSGTQWNTSTIESVGTGRCSTVFGPMSMALAGPSNTPVVAYHSHNFSVRGARFAACLLNCDTGIGVVWGRQSVDIAGNNVGHYITVRTDPVTRLPRLAYQDDQTSVQAILKYATCTDASSTQTCAQGQGNWTAGTVDQIFGVKVGAWASLDFRSDGTPVISYQDETNATLKVATCTGQCSNASAATWQKALVDLGPSTGKYTFLRVDSDGQARIAYYNTALRKLLYAVQSGTSSTYAITSVDSPVTEGQSSFVLAPPGTNFAYANSNGLRYYPTGF